MRAWTDDKENLHMIISDSEGNKLNLDVITAYEIWKPLQWWPEQLFCT